MATNPDLALRYLGDTLYGAILGQAGAVRPPNLVRALPHGMRVSVGLIRQVLADDQRFVEVAGRFDLADRETIRVRPFGGAIATLLAEYARPMPEDLMVMGLVRLRGGSPSYFRDLLEEYIATRDDALLVADRVVAADWILMLEDDDEETVLFYNDLDHDEDLRELWEKCRRRDLRKRDPALTAANILETFDRPIGPRQLAFLTWTHHPQIFEPVEFVADLIRRDDVAAACGQWMSGKLVEALHDELRRLSDAQAGEGEDLSEVDIAEVLAADPPATPYRLDPEDRDNILAVIREAQVPIGIDELVMDLLEITPDKRKFVAAAHAVRDAMEADASLMRVSAGRYISREAIPDWVHEIPAPLCPAVTEEDEDIILELEVLPGALLDAVLDPVYEDVCAGVEIKPDEAMIAGDSTQYPLLHHHFALGTMAIRAIDRELFSGEAPLTMLLMRHGEAGVFPAWLNRDLGLLFGLSRWYQRKLPPSGAVFTVTRGDAPDTYVLSYTGTVEDELAPDEDRMLLLERKRERVSHRPISTRDLMVELLSEHDGGLTFNALWAEMNVVRATSRWQIASLLAFYPCFGEIDGMWAVDTDLVREPGDEVLAEFVVGRGE